MHISFTVFSLATAALAATNRTHAIPATTALQQSLKYLSLSLSCQSLLRRSTSLPTTNALRVVITAATAYTIIYN
ncbi:hypothetical protein BT63DRAFT_420768 [Microthyrium microscopicum]|uniref:Secreted protein n=1 Tax=Microthyrium microscopicum TaxID=703497 RepID=A0A6A6UVW1_9PEZI|nr:hypothetical protein BT63DRAFT_420768 [Microthyrium microscopicum]